MNTRTIQIFIFAVSAAALTACSEKESQCDSSYEAACIDATHIQVCQDGELVKNECPSNNACTTKDNKAACTPAGTCTHEKPICKGDILETCINGYASEGKCPYGCDSELGKCKDRVIDTCSQDGETRCDPSDPNYLQTCSHSSWLRSKCDYGCVAGSCYDPNACETQCTDEHTVSVKCPDKEAYGATCAVGCSNNKCLDVAIEGIGTSCKSDFEDKCVGPHLAYCSDDHVVKEAYCFGESSCQKSSLIPGFADCVKTCETPSAPVNECIFDLDEGGSYLVQSSCETIGDKNYKFRKVLDFCYTGCNDTNTGCALEKEYESCDPSKDVEASCSTDGKYTIYCDEKAKFWTGDICPEGKTCVTSNKKAYCMEPCEASEKGNERYSCLNTTYYGLPLAYSNREVCTELDQGKYGWAIPSKQDQTQCDSLKCDDTTGKCAILAADQGKECDASYQAHCEGSVAVFCSDATETQKGVVGTVDCKVFSGEEFTCQILNGTKNCIRACDQAGAEKKGCALDENYNFAAIQMKCEENGSGTLVWKTGETLYSCSDECADDYSDCQKTVEDEYTACDENFAERCENGAAVFCDNGVVKTTHCAANGRQCVKLEDGEAHCYKPCNSIGPVKHCDALKKEAYVSQCTRLDDGSFVEIIDTSSTTKCASGCNALQTGCK